MPFDRECSEEYVVTLSSKVIYKIIFCFGENGVRIKS